MVIDIAIERNIYAKRVEFKYSLIDAIMKLC